MDILQHFNYLWHNYNLLNDLLQNIWNLYEFLLVRNYWDGCLLISIDNLKDLFDVVDVSNNLFELLHDNCFFNYFFDFSDCFIFIFYFNDFFTFLNYFFDLLDYNWHFNNFLNNFFYVSVNIDKLWNDSFNLNNFRNFNYNL